MLKSRNVDHMKVINRTSQFHQFFKIILTLYPC